MSNKAESDLKFVKSNYKTLINVIEKNVASGVEISCLAKEEDFTLTCEIVFKATPIRIDVILDPVEDIISIAAPIDVTVGVEHRDNLVMAVVFVNRYFYDGFYDYDEASCSLTFRLSNTIAKSLFSESAIETMLERVLYAVEYFRDALIEVARGDKTLNQFITYAKEIERTA